MTLTEKILLEFQIPLDDVFKKVDSHFYAFVQRDTTRFKTIEEKMDIINTLEQYRLKSGAGLPTYVINPNMLVATQENVDYDKTKQISLRTNKKNPFVVRLNGVFYLLDGHHRVFNSIKDGERRVKINFLDLDKVVY